MKDSIRNHAILNVVVEECEIFATKERCPFLLIFEIFRPEEIINPEDFADLYQLDDLRKKGLQDAQMAYLRFDHLISQPITLKSYNPIVDFDSEYHRKMSLEKEYKRDRLYSMQISSDSDLINPNSELFPK